MSELYPAIGEDELRGVEFYQATVKRSLLSWTRLSSFKVGDVLIVQKTNLAFAVVRAIMRDGVFRSVVPIYNPDYVYLISVMELTHWIPRPKLQAFEGIDKYIMTGVWMS